MRARVTRTRMQRCRRRRGVLIANLHLAPAADAAGGVNGNPVDVADAASTSAADRRCGRPTTRFGAGSVAITYSGSPAATPSPRRWPTVKWCTPACSPTTRPSAVDEFARRVRRRDSLLLEVAVDERRVVAVRHEANLLAVGLCGRRDAQFARQFAHLRLLACRPAETACARVDPASGRTENTSGPWRDPRCCASPSGRSRHRRSNARVVTGGDFSAPTPSRHFQKLIELDEVVAQRARDRRAPGQIFLDERLHHLLLQSAPRN